jgi:oligopeptide transport system ATP-binding protein
MSETSLLQVEGLKTQFHTRNGIVHAVDGVTFDVRAGETLGLVGESGCGKSVTALSLMRLLPIPPARIVEGTIIFEGRDVLAMGDREIRRLRGHSIAMIFQDPMTSLNPVLPIGRQIRETLELHLKMSKREASERAVELLTRVGIAGTKKRLDDYPHQLSGGMRQRVMIAMALACNPKLVLADEITTALDVTVQAQILELLRELAQGSGTAFVMITHDLGIVAGMTQRVNVMYAGRIVEKAPTRELFANPQMPYTWGLLGSIPRLDEERKSQLTAIPGLPPNLVDPPAGCRFAPRCRYARDICHVGEPELLPVAEEPEHESRCWGTQDVPGGGWLKGYDWRRVLPTEAGEVAA